MKVEVKTSTDQSGQIRIDTRDVDTESELEVKKTGQNLWFTQKRKEIIIGRMTRMLR